MDKIAIIGLGYVGLPLAKVFVNKGATVFGIDANCAKVDSIKKGKTYLSDVTNRDIKAMVKTTKFHVDCSFQSIGEADVIILCVPTPLTAERTPDISNIKNAVQSCLPYLGNGQLIVLESSTYPGTTEEIIAPLVTARGFNIGKNFYVAYSPERINPGETTFKLEEIPKVVGGITKACMVRAMNFYKRAFHEVIPVTSTKVAEMSKLVENAQRLINISFINEIAILCDKLNINIWEVVDACGTKPFGFTPFYPGPGVGGHCIPVDPLYLQWIAVRENYNLSLINASTIVNDSMPRYVVEKVIKKLNKPISGSKLFIIGVTYKKNVNDMRYSKAVDVMKQLLELGAFVQYYDPLIKELTIGHTTFHSTPICSVTLQSSDCILILTDHTGIPYEEVAREAKLVIDTRNAMGGHRTTE